MSNTHYMKTKMAERDENEALVIRKEENCNDGKRDESSIINRLMEIDVMENLRTRLNSDSELCLRLENDILEQLESVEMLEQRVFQIEERLRDLVETKVFEEQQNQMASDDQSQPSSQTQEEENIERNSNSDMEVILQKLEKDFAEQRKQWMLEKEELLRRQKKLEDELKVFQEQSISTPVPTEREATRKKTIEGCKISDSLDWSLFPLVVQCFVALNSVSYRRQIESSCVLIQRIFRGYAVRKRIQAMHRPILNMSRKLAVKDREPSIESLESDSAATNGTASPLGMLSSSVDCLLIPSSETNDATHEPDNIPQQDYDNNNHQHHNKEGKYERNKAKQPRKSSLTTFTQSHQSKDHQLANNRSWSVSGIAEWKDSTDKVITGIRNLKDFQQFLSKKISKLKDEFRSKTSVYDTIFSQALEEIHQSTLPTQPLQGGSVNLSYKDLTDWFEAALRSKAKQKNVTLESNPIFINAFRGYVDEFVKKKFNRELSDGKTKKDKQRDRSQSVGSGGGAGETVNGCGSGDGDGQSITSTLSVLSADILVLLEKLMAAIEERSLQVVGLYRKAGNANKIKELIRDINSSSSVVDFSEQDHHVITSVLKSFLRQLPEPLVTWELYEEFIRLPDIIESKDRRQSLIIVLNKLPQLNRNLLERLSTHLTRVVMQESSNRMSANALAIVFAPCVLRTSKNQEALIDNLNEIQKQVAFLQLLIESKMEEVRNNSSVANSSGTNVVTDTNIARDENTNIADTSMNANQTDTDNVILVQAVTDNCSDNLNNSEDTAIFDCFAVDSTKIDDDDETTDNTAMTLPMPLLTSDT